MADLKTLAIFVKVAERRSFVRAAGELGITQSGVSNAVARLEDRLGVRLLARTTRSVNLTEDGAAFFERCRAILADLEEAEAVLTRARLKPAGRLRVDLPVSFGRVKVVPLLGGFRADYPDLRLEASFTDRFVDLVEEGIDVAVRIGPLRDSSLIARRLTTSRLRTVGSPAYFARHGRPRTPEDLRRHNCLPFAIRDTHRVRPWHFERAGAEVTLSPTGDPSFTDGTALVAAAAAGLGIIQIQDYSTDEAVASGALEPVLEKFKPSAEPISLVYPETRHLSPKVRAFIDFMVRQFR